MNKYLIYPAALLLLIGSVSCSKTKGQKEPASVKEITAIVKDEQEDAFSINARRKKIKDFVPKGYVIFDTIYGDLNKDGQKDCVFIIKATDKSQFINDESQGELDRNRRGIIVLLKKNDAYELVVINYNCFSSENEDGGVYFAPELSFEISKGKLFINYSHGRYGYWEYTFRYQNSDLELIGYDSSSNSGPVINSETSINFLTGKRITNENTNENADSGEEVFKKIVAKVSKNKLTKLSEIEDFDEFQVLDQ